MIMNFLVSIFCYWLMLTCDATPVVIHHVPRVEPTSFTIQTVNIGAISTKTVKPLVGSKPKSIKVGGTGDAPATYFARVENGTVQYVVVADQAWVDAQGGSLVWVQTDMNGSIRKNSAGKGYTYDKGLDAFIAPKPTTDAIFDAQTAKWTIPPKVQTPEEILFYSASSTENI